MAVECFHKASLVHDDIEDNDSLRYGEPTLHEAYGVPFALNVGDFLLGEGYRLIGDCDVPAENRVAMLQAAAAGHRVLCVGQGAELAWVRSPRPLRSTEVLEIFQQKTSPAFEVALRLGAAYAGVHAEFGDVIGRYSAALGIAYQIRDDLEDIKGETDDFSAMRPSLPLAILSRARPGGCRRSGPCSTHVEPHGHRGEQRRLAAMLDELGVVDRAEALLEAYKEEAIRSLIPLQNASLKGLLRRVISKIFAPEAKEWCREFEARNAASRPIGAENSRLIRPP